MKQIWFLASFGPVVTILTALGVARSNEPAVLGVAVVVACALVYVTRGHRPTVVTILAASAVTLRYATGSRSEIAAIAIGLLVIHASDRLNLGATPRADKGRNSMWDFMKAALDSLVGVIQKGEVDDRHTLIAVVALSVLPFVVVGVVFAGAHLGVGLVT